MVRKNCNYELYHHGVKGMHWGIWNSETRARYSGGKRRVRKYTEDSLKNAKVKNLEKWGKDRDHNVLYITGLSGSGKSTIAEGLRDKDTNVLHLDFYLEAGDSRYSNAQRDSEFNNHLKKTCPEYYSKLNGELPSLNGLSEEERKSIFKVIDKFADSIDSFGREQYKKNKRVIVEGVQILDDTLRTSRDYLKDKPLVIANVNANTALDRAAIRDEIDENDTEALFVRRQWQQFWETNLQDLEKTTEVQIGRDTVERLLRES